MQLAANASALRTPLHGAGGCGARQRRSPVGGAANGTPLKTAIAPSAAVTPARSPSATRAVGSGAPVRPATCAIETAPSSAIARTILIGAIVAVLAPVRA